MEKKLLIIFFDNKCGLVIMNTWFPDLLSTEVTKEIRNIEQARNRQFVSIIALTTHRNAARKECFEAGMNDFYK